MKTFKEYRNQIEEDGAIGVASGPTNVTGASIAAGPNDVGVKPEDQKLNKKRTISPVLATVKRNLPNGKIFK